MQIIEKRSCNSTISFVILFRKNNAQNLLFIIPQAVPFALSIPNVIVVKPQKVLFKTYFNHEHLSHSRTQSQTYPHTSYLPVVPSPQHGIKSRPTATELPPRARQDGVTFFGKCYPPQLGHSRKFRSFQLHSGSTFLLTGEAERVGTYSEKTGTIGSTSKVVHLRVEILLDRDPNVFSQHYHVVIVPRIKYSNP